jgi:hypothetical protein
MPGGGLMMEKDRVYGCGLVYVETGEGGVAGSSLWEVWREVVCGRNAGWMEEGRVYGCGLVYVEIEKVWRVMSEDGGR